MHHIIEGQMSWDKKEMIWVDVRIYESENREKISRCTLIPDFARK